jgi:hypothetical protein
MYPHNDYVKTLIVFPYSLPGRTGESGAHEPEPYRLQFCALILNILASYYRVMPVQCAGGRPTAYIWFHNGGLDRTRE